MSETSDRTDERDVDATVRPANRDDVETSDPTEERGVTASVRPANRDDVDAMLAIYRPIVEGTAISFELAAPTADELADRLATVTRRDPWLVCEIGSRVVGYAYATDFRARPAYATTRETTIYVDQAIHRQGVGARLLGELLAALTAGGIHRAVAGIVLPNPASVALHERFGYRHVGTFGQIGHKFGRWHDLGFWQRELDAGGRPSTLRSG